MTINLSPNHFTLQSIDFNANPALNKKAKCSVLLIKANWCGFCTRFLPTFEKLSSKYSKVNFLIVEEQNNQALLNGWANLVNPAFKIEGYPTVVLYAQDGNPIKVINRDELEQEISTMI